MPMTIVFDMAAENFPGNPFKLETAFGTALVIAKGDVCQEADVLRAERDHWLQFVSSADKMQFPFNPGQ